MYIDGKVWVGNNDEGERICIIPKMVNRHGLVAGATGTGKTITLKVMAETFSDMGVPVFMADVKGDIAGIPGQTVKICRSVLRSSTWQMRGLPTKDILLLYGIFMV